MEMWIWRRMLIRMVRQKEKINSITLIKAKIDVMKRTSGPLFGH